MKRVSWMAMLAAGLISHPGLSGQGIDIIPQPLVAEAQPGGSVLDGKVAIANADPVDTLREESAEGFDLRMAWWRQARFGLFLHWGVYAVPAGEWNGSTNHAEWILSTAQIPLQRYKQFASQFNPVGFDAAEWVRMAKEAGMKYIVIASACSTASSPNTR